MCMCVSVCVCVPTNELYINLVIGGGGEITSEFPKADLQSLNARQETSQVLNVYSSIIEFAVLNLFAKKNCLA